MEPESLLALTAKMEKRLVFDPDTGKLRVDDNHDNDRSVDAATALAMAAPGFFGCRFVVSHSKDRIMLNSESCCDKDVDVKTMHISCKSDTYELGHNYGGVIIYQYDGKSEWRTTNNTHCKSGYIVIQDTDSKKVKIWENERGKVHGAVYRSAFGESVDGVQPQRSFFEYVMELLGLTEATPIRETKVVGEGFSIQDRELKFNSNVFNNPKNSQYHDGLKKMSKVSEHCVRKVVEYWKSAGRTSVRQRNFKVEHLLEDFDWDSIDKFSY